ncbi:uncharacterized protein LOC128195264 [Vigna angularis]|uniref:uncharacterized protein LOC128195264 n=1 Tax=Phaseolus angularis TaxID=3914 RepID=UPI0022B4099F|nr:uncharacterized protein LOC128195264 [Vigna angularis]
MAPFEALYGKKCRTPLCWFQEGEVVLTGPEVIQKTIEKVKLIQEMLKTSKSRQKSHADRRRRPLATGDHVFLRLNPTTGIGRVVRSDKLSPKFIGPYQILKRIGLVAYDMVLPPQLSNLHPFFHVSQLRKYVADPSHVLEAKDVQIKEERSVEMKPVSIEGNQTKQLRGKTISLVKVVWDKRACDFTWEMEDVMRELYPHLFSGVVKIKLNGSVWELKNVRHILDLKRNLISVGQMANDGYTTVFHGNHWKISKGAMTVARGRKRGLFTRHKKLVI